MYRKDENNQIDRGPGCKKGREDKSNQIPSVFGPSGKIKPLVTVLKFAPLLARGPKSSQRVPTTTSCGCIWLDIQGEIPYTPSPQKRLLITCAMYVDKKLAGVDCVQTLSRLNRIYPGKAHSGTFVLDFFNAPEDILESFQPYCQTAELGDVSDPSKAEGFARVVFDLLQAKE